MNINFWVSSLMLFFLFNCQSQHHTLELSEGFAAFVVKDIQTSKSWYSSTFGFEIVNETNLEDRGIKMANLKLGHTKLELIESASAINPLENKKGLVLGIFKVGYVVPDFDAWQTHLMKHGLIAEADIVTDPTTNKRMLILRDPDGNRIQLFEK